MKLCTSFGTRLGTQVRDFSACYFGGARSKGFVTRKNVSKLHSDVTQRRKVRVFVWQGIRKLSFLTIRPHSQLIHNFYAEVYAPIASCFSTFGRGLVCGVGGGGGG